MRRWVTFFSAVCCLLLAASTAFAVTGPPKGRTKVGKTVSTTVTRMSFYDGTHGLAFFSGVGFKKTSDSGKTWSKVSNLPASFGMNDFAMATSKVGYLAGVGFTVGSGCMIYVTHDGGKHWIDKSSQLGPGEFRRVFAVDSKRAWAVGSGMVIYATSDGGDTWVKQNGDHYGFGALHSVYFTDKDHGWAAGNTSIPNNDVIVYRTVDGGAHWLSTTIDVNTNPSAIGFKDKLHGWMACNDQNTSTFYATSDGGATWELKSVPGFAGGPWKFGFVSASQGWLMSTNLWQTTNGGSTWKPYLTSTWLYAFDVPDRSHAYLWATSGGGKYQMYRWRR